MTVYIDSLFLTNLFMDTVLLLVTAYLLRRRLITLRLLAGAVFLSIYGTLLFFPEIKLIYSLVLKLLVAVAASLIVFGKRGIIKNTAVFLAVSAMCGGIIFALSIITDFGIVMQTMVSNCIMYMNLNPVLMMLGCVLLYLFAEVYKRVCQKNFSKDNMLTDVAFIYMGREYRVKALIDTGCSLTEPLSGAPVLVVSKGVVDKAVLSGAKIRANTAAGMSVLDLILPERIWSESVELYHRTEVAVSPLEIGEEGLYNALLNPQAVIDTKNVKECAERLKVNE